MYCQENSGWWFIEIIKVFKINEIIADIKIIHATYRIFTSTVKSEPRKMRLWKIKRANAYARIDPFWLWLQIYIHTIFRIDIYRIVYNISNFLMTIFLRIAEICNSPLITWMDDITGFLGLNFLQLCWSHLQSNPHITGSKKQSEERTALFPVRVYVIVMALLAKFSCNIYSIAIMLFKPLVKSNFFLFSRYYCLSIFAICIPSEEFGKTVLHWPIIVI